MTGWWRSHPVRVRLTIWFVLTMMAVVGVYAAAVLTFVRRSTSEALDQQIRRDFQWAAATVYQTPGGQFTWDEPAPVLDERDILWVQVWSGDGTQLLFASAEARRQPLPESRRLATVADGRIERLAATPDPVRILSHRGTIVDESNTRQTGVVIQVARAETEMIKSVGQLRLILALGLPLAVAAAGLGGYVLATRALRPVERMTEQARTITVERLGDRLPVENPDDEMGRLAVVFNETLSRLQDSFDQMRRFTADVSHQLRTPLTAIRSVGEVGLRSHRDEASYRAVIGSMLEEADRLATLVDRLLTLSRAETGQSPLHIEPIDMRDLADDVASHLGVLAEEQQQAIEIEGIESAMALGDRVVIRQALINLVDNAIKFSGMSGRVRIRVGEERGRVVADVSDSGPGIPMAARERIFDRFYRASSAAAGTGLGLSVARGAVEANGGELTLVSTGPSGSTFRIALPPA